MDIERLDAFLRSYSSDAADRALELILAAADDLLAFPERGRISAKAQGLREVFISFGARGYVIRYRLEESDVFIARVWHALENRR